MNEKELVHKYFSIFIFSMKTTFGTFHNKAHTE